MDGKQTKHSQGPWKTKYTGLSIQVRDGGDNFVAIVSGLAFTEKRAHEKVTADGKLIAAAPELFEYVRRIADREGDGMIDQAREILARYGLWEATK